MNESEKTELGMSDNEIRSVISNLSGDVYEYFAKDHPCGRNLFTLNTQILVCAIGDANTDIGRVGSYHSKTGANAYKKAAYIAKRIAEMKPIMLQAHFPVNQTNANHLFCINASFAVFCLDALLGCDKIYPRLSQDLRYAFHFRHRMDSDTLSMMLEHCLKHTLDQHK